MGKRNPLSYPAPQPGAAVCQGLGRLVPHGLSGRRQGRKEEGRGGPDRNNAGLQPGARVWRTKERGGKGRELRGGEEKEKSKTERWREVFHLGAHTIPLQVPIAS